MEKTITGKELADYVIGRIRKNMEKADKGELKGALLLLNAAGDARMTKLLRDFEIMTVAEIDEVLKGVKNEQDI